MSASEIISEKLSSTYDRLQEAHWNIHQMEFHYHEADLFRYSLNSFLRVLKEIPQILQMELQNEPGFSNWYKERKQITFQDPLISDLFKKRDIVVHRTMLKPKSSAYLGITEGRGMKLGLQLPMNPLEDSDVLMIKYLKVISKSSVDILGVVADDEDSIPCIERFWGLKPFDEDIINISAKAWTQTCTLLSDAIVWLGGDSIAHELECIHSSSKISYRLYNRKWLNEIIIQIKDGKSFEELLSMLKTYRYRIST